MSFESLKEKGSDSGYIEKSGKGRQGKWTNGTQTEGVVSDEFMESKDNNSSEEVVEEDIKVEISPLSPNTISFLRESSADAVLVTLWSPEILRGLREAGFVVEGVTPEFSPDSSIGVACTDTRNRLQEFVLNPREAVALLNSAVSLYDDEVKNESEKKPGKNQKKLLDVNASKIKTHFSAGQTLNVHRLEREMNNLKYTNEVPVSVYPHKPEVVVDHGDVPLLNHGSLKEGTVDFLHGIVSTNMWVPDLEASLAREGFSNSSNDIESSGERVYTYKTSDGMVQRCTLTPESALSMLQRAMEAEQPIVQREEELVIEVKVSEQNALPIGITEIVSERKSGEKKSFDTRFETEFGITEEQVSQIEGYERLSEGQLKLVLENMRECARDTRGGYLSRAWEGVLKSTGREAKDKNYVEAVTVLIRNTAQFGPKVHEENGELLTDFIDVGIPQQFRKEHKPIFDRFNALAHQYAKLKVEDLEDGIGTHSKDESKFVSFLKNTFSESRRKHDAYESLQESYEGAKREFAQSLAEMGRSEGEIAGKLIEIDSKVHSLRFLQTEPEAVDVIKQNPDKSFWQKVGEKVFSKENMTYAGLGFVGRMALAGAMGLYAAPVVASAVGGIRSWNKTAAELREKDRVARGGTRDTSSEALNIVDVTREIETGGRKKDVGVTQKLQDLIERYKSFEYEGGKIAERNSVVESMRARVQYIEDKIKLNRINFGSGALRATNMANLFETLGEARVLLADMEMPKGGVLEARLEQYLISREGLIQTRRRKKQIKTATWGTLKAGALALAGRELAEYVQETGFFSKEEGVASGVAGGATSVPQSAEAPLPKQYGYQAEVRAIDNETVPKVEIPRTERVGIRGGDTSPETTPQASSPSPQSPDAQIPNNEIPDIQPVEEVQKVDVEKVAETRPYSDDVTAVDESARVANPPDEVIEIKGYPPIKTIEANDHVWSKVPEEGVRIPKDLEVSDTAPEAQAEGGSSRPYAEESSVPEKDSAVLDAGTSSDNSVENEIRQPESTIPDYSKNGGTVLDSESNTPEVKPTSGILSSQETFKNTHGVEVNPKKEHIYELTGQGGERVMVSYGGKDFGTRFDTAQEYVQKNPDAVVVVEEEQRYGAFGQKLPPSYVEVRNIPGEGVTTVFSIQDSTLPASSEKGIDPSTFTKKVTK